MNRDAMGEAPGRAPSDGVLLKRSITIAGHRTSVSLEGAFWDGLRTVAARRAQSVAALVAEVDQGRGAANLSSALRVLVLRALTSHSVSG